MLTKTTSLLHRFSADDAPTQSFISQVDEPGDRITSVHVDTDVWVELDRPEIVTVTIEPGDKLNGE
jgi:hypothetical protein